MTNTGNEAKKIQNRGALRIAGLYFLIGALWILFSDQIAAVLAPNEQALITISMVKGWVYVIVTALFLYWLIRREISAMQASREAIRLSEERFHTLIDEAPLAIALSRDGKFLYVNPTYLSMHAISSVSELIGQPVLTQVAPESRLESEERTNRRNSGLPVENNYEYMAVRRDGKHIPVLAAVTRVNLADGPATIGFFQDITELKDTQQALQELNRTLEQRVKERTNAIETSNKELEAFAYSISHDLRAPLRSIDGFSRIIEEDYTAHLEAEAIRMIHVIRDSTQRMDHLISDILALSRVSRADLSISPVDMTDLARKVYAELVPEDVRSTFTFTISPLPRASGDPTLLRQVWVNLISNAIKYTLPCTDRRIEIGAYPDKGMNVFFVKDTGVGFDQAYAYKLFGLFQRLHRAEEFEGTGVGLAIVQRIINRHGGQTWAEGKINQGAAVYFSLPENMLENE